MRVKIDKLDTLFSRYIRTRAGGRCQINAPKCRGSVGFKSLDTCHFHGRRKRSVRWNEDNAVAGCFTCHRYLDENPLFAVEFFKNRLGQKKFDLLNIQANMPQKVDRKAVELYLRQKISELEEHDDTRTR